MLPKKIYLRKEELNEQFMSERMVSCDAPIGSCNVEYTDISQVWHDVSEEPEHGKYILIEVVSTTQVRYFVEYVEKWVVNLMKTEGFKCRWAYIIDLLSKGGKE